MVDPEFVDREAEFVFLPRDTDWSEIDNGLAFDVPKCELGHHGQDVSFNSILRKYDLTDPALPLLGEIVRAADSRPLDPHAAGEGLRWIASGFGALRLTDHEILEREFVVYDALYAECKHRVAMANKASPAGPCYTVETGSIFELLSKVR